MAPSDTASPRRAAWTGLGLQSRVSRDGELRLSLEDISIPPPGPDEMIVRLEAAPINPSDLGTLLAAADLQTLAASGTPERPVLTARVPADWLPNLAGRLDIGVAVGNEGAGVVVAAGDNLAHLLGRTVALVGGATYAQYRCVELKDCLPLPDGATAVDGASSFINPLTALGMIETMRRTGHTALVHTAAASNLGQMLNRICQADAVPLVNIVRSPEQARLLRDARARHVVDSSAPDFLAQLTDAIEDTDATLAFDAIGGGELAGAILKSMDRAALRRPAAYSRYGSTVHKQVYLYGTLDPGPVTFRRDFGMAWGMGGWLLFPFLNSLAPTDVERLKGRVAAELQTTFASRYTRQISLHEALQPDVLRAYSRRSTGEKYLLTPNRGQGR